MKKNTRTIILMLVIIAASVVLIAGAHRFFVLTLPESGGLTALGMSLQNWALTMLFNPILTIQDVVSDALLPAVASGADRLLLYAFCVASVLIPFVEVLVVLRLLNRFLYMFSGFTFAGNRILVFGYHAQIRQMLLAEKKIGKVFLWTDESIPDEDARELNLRGVAVTSDAAFPNTAKEKKRMSRFLKRKGISRILLADESDVVNLQRFMVLSNLDGAKNSKDLRFYVRINAYDTRRVLEDYFNKTLSHACDLTIFNLPQIQAEQLFEEMPLDTKTNDKQGVHLLVIGAGGFGEALLLHAMNQGVLSEDNDILIDVIDRNMEDLCARLRNRFHHKYVTEETGQLSHEDTTRAYPLFSVPGNKTDGSLRIRCFEQDVYGSGFGELLKALQKEKDKADKPFTYLAVCMPDPDANLHCYRELRNAGVLADTPVALRLSDVEETRAFLENDGNLKSRVVLTGLYEESIGLDRIMDTERERRMREFHRTYEQKPEEDADVLWNGLKYYRRASNRALYNHRTVKEKMMNKALEAEWRAFWDECLRRHEEESAKQEPEQESEQNVKKKSEPDPELQSRVLVNPDEKRFPLLVAFAKMEHRRFNYFYASEGWGYIKADKKDEDARLHNSLCTWVCLKKEDATKGQLAYDLIAVKCEYGKKT